MQKKNVIFLVIDSLYYDKIIKNEYRNSPMPFLNKLQKNGLNAEKMYSEAPYTEAALISLLSGIDTLKQGGYLKRFKNKKTIMDVFKENGYTTFFNGYQPHIYPSCSYPGVTEKYYNVCYDFLTLWSYRLNYYCELYKDNKLNEKDYNLLIDIMDDNFKEWIIALEKMKNKDKEMSFIINNISIDDIDINIKKLKEEHKKYLKDKLNYIKELFIQEKNHELFKIKNYKSNRQTTEAFRKEFYKNNKKFFRKIYWTNFRKNLKNNHLDFKRFFIDKNLTINYIKMYKNTIFDKDLMSKIEWDNYDLKNSPSIYGHLQHFYQWYNERKEETPFFAYIHTGDCHYPEVFHSHDISDLDRLNYELNLSKEYLKKIPKNYKGNLAYDLSLRYIDDCIENLWDFLEENNLTDNTYLAICADHGSSYTYTPIHENYVRNEYHENYHIPFVVAGGNIAKENNKNFHNSKDIPATIIDLAGLKIPKTFDGKSLYKNNDKDYVIIENINGGCPDYNRREVMLGARTNNYAVTMIFDMKKNFVDGTIKSIYNLKNDPMEYYNLKNDNKIIEKIKYEKEIIKNTFDDLKKDINKNNFLN